METEKEPTEHNAFVEVSQEDLPSTATASPQIHSCARLDDGNQKPPSEFSVCSDVEEKKKNNQYEVDLTPGLVMPKIGKVIAEGRFANEADLLARGHDVINDHYSLKPPSEFSVHSDVEKKKTLNALIPEIFPYIEL